MPCHSTCGRETWPTLRMSNALALFIVCIRVACRSLPLRLLTLLAPRFLLAALTTSLALQQPDRRATPPIPCRQPPTLPQKSHSTKPKVQTHKQTGARGPHGAKWRAHQIETWSLASEMELGTRNSELGLAWLGLAWKMQTVNFIKLLRQRKKTTTYFIDWFVDYWENVVHIFLLSRKSYCIVPKRCVNVNESSITSW